MVFKIGEALKKLFEDGVVERKDLWITSKLWFAIFPFHLTPVSYTFVNFPPFILKQEF